VQSGILVSRQSIDCDQTDEDGYLRLDVVRLDADGNGEPDWGEVAYLVGIDTYDARRGDHRMPVGETLRSPAGGAGTPKDLPPYAWRGWDRPSYRIEKEESWTILKRALEANPAEDGP
jgi:hypothetical protein